MHDCAPFVLRNDQRTVWAPHACLCAITDVGGRRLTNEDSFQILHEERVFVVADGIGGGPAGEVASDIATGTVAEHIFGWLSRGGPCGGSMLLSALEAANHAVLGAAAVRKELFGMSATIIVACVQDDRLYTAHLGDVRCYVQSRGRLTRLTRDHTPVAELLAQGLLGEDQVARNPQRHVVNQAAGMDHVEPTLNECTLGAGDRVLLCTDGVWAALTGQDLATIMKWQGAMRQVATQLIDNALRRSGSDNMTLVLYEHV